MNWKRFLIYTFAGVFYILAVVAMLIMVLSIIITIPGVIFFSWTVDWWLFTVCLLWILGSIVPFFLSRKRIFSKMKEAWNFRIIYPEK